MTVFESFEGQEGRVSPLYSAGPQATTDEGHRAFTRLALALMAVDILAILIAFAGGLGIAAIIRMSAGVDAISISALIDQRGEILAMLVVLTILTFRMNDLYSRGSWEMEEIRRIAGSILLIAMFDATLQYAMKDHNSRLWFATAYPLAIASVIACRMAFRRIQYVREAMTNHLVVIGAGVPAETLIYQMRGSRSGDLKLLQSIALSKVQGREPEVLNQLLERLARHKGVPAHRINVVLAPAPEEIEAAQSLIGRLHAAGRQVDLVLPFRGLARNGVSLRKVVGADMVVAEIQPVRDPWIARVVKRVFDLVAGVLILALIAPLLAIIAVFLRLERGPTFFVQDRVGRDRKTFRCFKFRSMLPDAEARLQDMLDNDPVARAEWAVNQKLTNDPRITRLGHLLRKSSFDELPQIFNVLKGNMSLVGPRPIIAPHVPGYAGDKAYFDSPEFEHYAACTPGITGLWQVSGRSDTDHDERVRLDRWYARNWSFWLDLMILSKTFHAVLARRERA